MSPRICRSHLTEPFRGAQRHAPHALDQAETEHRGDCPELADRQRRDPLEGLNEEIDVLEVDPALGVRDQRDRELVHPRIARERTLRQLGQLLVIALRQTLPHLADVLLDDVIVVEEPLSRGADVHFVGSGIRELSLCIVEQPLRIVEPDQQSGVAADGVGGARGADPRRWRGHDRQDARRRGAHRGSVRRGALRVRRSGAGRSVRRSEGAVRT